MERFGRLLRDNHQQMDYFVVKSQRKGSHGNGVWQRRLRSTICRLDHNGTTKITAHLENRRWLFSELDTNG